MVEVFSSLEGKFSIEGAFLGVYILAVGYRAEIKRSDFYLLRNDPWIEREKNPCFFNLPIGTPEGATHYILGPKKDIYSNGLSIDYIPIAFFQK